jgi:hypothetical protein
MHVTAKALKNGAEWAYSPRKNVGALCHGYRCVEHENEAVPDVCEIDMINVVRTSFSVAE